MDGKGFTLAEVLITLGIIGVVASMTLPAIVQSNKNKEVEAKLQKIYTVMNQAILLSEKDNGPKEYWEFSCTADDNNIGDDCREGVEKYFIPYLKTTKVDSFTNSLGFNTIMYFPDGSILIGKINTIAGNNNALDFYFYPNGKNFSESGFGATNDGITSREDCGKTFFAFRFAPSINDTNNKFHYKKGFEPYKWSLTELTSDALTSADRNGYYCSKESRYNIWCTALIQLNGWKIPDDYPFKVK